MWRLENQTGVIKQYPATLENRQFTLASTSQVIFLKIHVFVIASEGNMMGSEHWFLHCEASVLLSYKSTFRDACAFVQEHGSRHQADWAYSASILQIKIKYMYNNNTNFAKFLVKLTAHVLI